MKRIYFLCCLFLIFSCKEEVTSVAAYSKWINKKENGLISTRKINNLKITVKYLPSDYLIYKDVTGNNLTDAGIDSIKKKYENTLTFLMSLEPDDERGNKSDVMYGGVGSYEEYSKRLLAMNFDMAKNIQLKTDALELKPVLSVLENTYGLSKGRTIVIAFAPDDQQKTKLSESKQWDFIYSDELFQLGTMHFNFNKNDITHLPVIKESIK
jgi:hypothetical protein